MSRHRSSSSASLRQTRQRSFSCWSKWRRAWRLPPVTTSGATRTCKPTTASWTQVCCANETGGSSVSFSCKMEAQMARLVLHQPRVAVINMAIFHFFVAALALDNVWTQAGQN